MREVQRKTEAPGFTPETPKAASDLTLWLERAERVRTQQRHTKNKLYALHAPEVECMGKGKARKPCEFGVKADVVISHQTGLMVGARSFPGNPYDGHILSAILEQAANLLQDLPVKIKVVVGDLGFRGVDADNPDKLIIHRGKFKRLNPQQKAWLRRRQAVEPAIGHLKSDHRMNRCWLKGAVGDALHTISCAAALQPALAAACHCPFGHWAGFFVPASNGAVPSDGPAGLVPWRRPPSIDCLTRMQPVHWRSAGLP